MEVTHQLEFAPAPVGLLDARVTPECLEGRYIQLESTGLHRHPCLVLERHNKHAMLLIFRVLPGYLELVPGIHQHPHALKETKRQRTWERETFLMHKSLMSHALLVLDTVASASAIKTALTRCWECEWTLDYSTASFPETALKSLLWRQDAHCNVIHTEPFKENFSIQLVFTMLFISTM